MGTTTVHLPAALLTAIDRRANELKVSRNRLIVETLDHALRAQTEWSAHLLDVLGRASDDRRAAADELLAEVHDARASRGDSPV
jgi:hypothetical protein